MNIEDIIVDYDRNKKEIDKWVNLKSPEKYFEYCHVLIKAKIECNWKNVSDLYRYDKRLNFNLWKYISFFEEYYRSVLLNKVTNRQEQYSKIQGVYLTSRLLDDLKLLNYLNEYEMNLFNDAIKIRNTVAHSKRIVGIKSSRKKIVSLLQLLPSNYHEGFRTDINNCKNGLKIKAKLLIEIL